ncbi:MAG: sigma-70 family RNA polymerase sigma factor [Bacteroidales bacterium]|nr:sigma-70 family RNA polymerase sigma factor [Bacteroidales bacterium]
MLRINYLKSSYHRNKAESIESISPDEAEAFFTPPDNCLESRELEDIIQKAILALPEKCRTILTLKRFENLSNKEIAAKLSISVKTVENQMTIALKKLNKAVYKDLKFFALIFLKALL